MTRPAKLVQAALKETAYIVVRWADLRPFHELQYLVFGPKASIVFFEAGKMVPIPAGAAVVYACRPERRAGRKGSPVLGVPLRKSTVLVILSRSDGRRRRVMEHSWWWAQSAFASE